MIFVNFLWINDHNVGIRGLWCFVKRKPMNYIILCEEKQHFGSKIISRCNIGMLFCLNSQSSVSVNAHFPLVASYSHRHSVLSLWFRFGWVLYRSMTFAFPQTLTQTVTSINCDFRCTSSYRFLFSLFRQNNVRFALQTLAFGMR